MTAAENLARWWGVALAATDGPWESESMPRHPGVWNVWGVRPDEVIGDGQVCVADVRGYERDADFIATARTAMPALLAFAQAALALADSDRSAALSIQLQDIATEHLGGAR